MSDNQEETPKETPKEIPEDAPKEEKKKLVPKDNKLQVGTKRGPGHYVFISKIFFKQFEEIELHGIGQAVANLAQCAEILKREKLATVTSIEQFQWEPEDKEEDEGDDENPRRRRNLVKMIIGLKRSENFFTDVDTENF